MSDHLFESTSWRKSLKKLIRAEISPCSFCNSKTVIVAHPAEGDIVELHCLGCALVGLRKKRFQIQLESNKYARSLPTGTKISGEDEIEEVMGRPKVDSLFLEKTIERVSQRLADRLKKDDGALASHQESMGVLLDKIGDYAQAIKLKDAEDEFMHLGEIAVAAMFAMACHLAGYIGQEQEDDLQ